MILQKSARFLIICLCAIMFHGNVFAVDDLDCTNTDKPYPNENHSECTTCTDDGFGVVGDVCVKCGDTQYSLFIPGEATGTGNNTNDHNVCVDSTIENANCSGDVCVCKGGYFFIEGDGFFVNTGCYECENNQITENNVCVSCTGGKVPNENRNACVCPNNMIENNGTCGCGDNLLISLDGNSCVNTCASDEAVDGNRCVKCTNYFLQPDENGINRCVQSCSKGYEAENNVCKTCGELNKHADKDGNCVSGCEQGYALDTEENICKSCKDLGKVYQNNTCQENCEIGYVPDGNGICVSCNSGQYINYNGGVFDQKFNDGLKVPENCADCPVNFICNGATKKRCDYGYVRGQGESSCKKIVENGKGFMFCPVANQCVYVSQSDYYASSDENIENYKYVLCNTFDNITDNIDEINVCRECKEYEHPSNNKCYCGEKNEDNKYGLIEDTLNIGREEKCQKCPNGVTSSYNYATDFLCNPCEAGKGLVEEKGKYVCKACSGDAALYENWCINFEDFRKDSVKGEAEAHKYYRYYNGSGYVWELCPAGSCCYNGNATSCNMGTYSGEGAVCDKDLTGEFVAGACTACKNGKTTTGTGTKCEYGTSCENIVCTEDVEATKFCIGENKNLCFDIGPMKMRASGYYNINYVNED